MRVAFLLAVLAVTLPDLRTGNVNGLTGILFWPAHPNKPNGDPDPWESADGCVVHAVPHNDRDRELLYPCGKWFVLPEAGPYNYWLESDGQMTPTIGLFIHAHKPFNGGGLGSIVPLTPAGRISIPPDRTLAVTESFRLLSIEAKDSWHPKPGTGRIFDRRVSAADARTPVQMPVGRVVAGRFDRATNDAIALSRPLEIKAGTTTRVWPTPPRNSDLLVVLSKHPDLPQSKPIDVSLTLDDGTTKKPPDVLLHTFDRVVAIWYGLDLPRANLSLKSDVAFFEPREVRFTRGKVTTLRAEIAPLPKAKVSINAPPDTPALALDVRRLASPEPIRHVNVQPGVHELEALPAELLQITLTAGEWKSKKHIDLSSGQDATVTFNLEPINVTGTVYYGEDPARAEIEFRNDEEWRVVKTNERGEYETVFWWPDVHTARVRIAKRNQPPFLDAFREIFESGTVDFHVPRTDYTVHVRDAVTHQPIAGAQVTAGSITEDERRSAQHVITDENGTAILPPIRKGELIVDVRAERYASREPLRLTVDAEHHELDVDLQPLTTAATLRLLLPNGTPASRAEVWAFSDAMQPLWRGASNEEGELDVPDIAANALLIVRHANAASTIRRVDANDKTWTLEAPAEPLTLVAEQTNGAMVAVWLDGVKLFGPPLVFATWSSPATNPSGIWIGRNLPRKATNVLVAPFSAITSNTHDALAHHVEYPWPQRVLTPKN